MADKRFEHRPVGKGVDNQLRLIVAGAVGDCRCGIERPHCARGDFDEGRSIRRHADFGMPAAIADFERVQDANNVAR